MLNVFRLGRTKTLLFFILKEKMKLTIHLLTPYIKKYFYTVLMKLTISLEWTFLKCYQNLNKIEQKRRILCTFTPCFLFWY